MKTKFIMKKLLALSIACCYYLHLVQAQCADPTAHSFLDINNVRARINLGQSSWWDLIGSASYEVPKGSGKHCFFTGSLWVGGIDEQGQIRGAAARFRQVGQDFWPGPLDSNGQIDSVSCTENDRIYKLNKWQVAEFRVRYNEAGYVIPDDILEWPATGNVFAQTDAKAPFIDVNQNGIYEPTFGDYPAFAFDEPADVDFHLLGDQCLWWVENDQGNVHTETQGEPMGLEMQFMAYAYSTCDPLNDQTFYRSKFINKGDHPFHDVYIGQWVDADIGYANDDYVQCEVMRSIGFAYNGFAVDGTGGPMQYGPHPPAAGIGILRGPFADSNDGVDNDRDGIIDEAGERLAMSHFVYHNNIGGNPAQQDPQTMEDYYNYMRGIWKDGTPMCYGMTGHPAGGCDTGVEADFMFPGDSDPLGFGTGGIPQPIWTEQTSGNVPLDRRFLLSVGPFSLAVSDTAILHFGALWARDTLNEDPLAAAEVLYEVKDLCQSRFDAGFAFSDCCPPQTEIALYQSGPNLFFLASTTEALSYHWDFGDGSTSDERFPPAHSYADDAVYQVTLIVTNSCGSDTAYLQVSSLFFGLNDGTSNTAFKAYPNPATNEINVQVDLPSNGAYSLILRAMDGREVIRHSNISTVRTSVNVNGLGSGIYVLSLESRLGAKHMRIEVLH
jgi:hypothetical protein